MTRRLKERQTSFAGGEWAPSLFGRTDLAKYQHACRTALNFFVSPHGTLLNRPGSRYVDVLRDAGTGVDLRWGINSDVDGTGQDAGKPRLVPFIYSDTDALLLVFTDHRLDIFKYNSTLGFVERLAARVTGDGDSEFGGDVAMGHPDSSVFNLSAEHDDPFAIINNSYAQFPWSTTDLPKMRFSQVGNILTCVCETLTPFTLTRNTADSLDWSYSELSFDVPEFPTYGGTPRITVQWEWSSGQYYMSPWDHTEPLHMQWAGDANHEALEWQWKVTRVIEDEDGHTYETAPFTVEECAHHDMELYHANHAYLRGAGPDDSTAVVAYLVEDPDVVFFPKTTTVPPATPPTVGASDANWMRVNATGADGTWALNTTLTYPKKLARYEAAPATLACYADRPVRIAWPVFPWEQDQEPTDEPRIVETRVYRGRDDVFGFVGAVGEGGGYFIDKGTEPDWAYPPPSGLNPFVVKDRDGNELRTEKPATICMFEGRRMLGGTTERPQTVWGSAVEAYQNFDRIIPPNANDALEFELATNKYERIKALIPRSQLLVLTDCSEWGVAGSGQLEVLTPDSIAARPISEYGCGDLEPLSFAEAVLFLQRKGTTPRMFSQTNRGYQMIDCSTWSHHLFVGHSIVSWCYAEDPYGVIWAVRDDGVLLSLTYNAQQEMLAWTRHTITGGTVEAVCSIPEDSEDGVYLAVRRGSDLYLERLASRVLTDVQEAIFLDCSTTVDQRGGSLIQYVDLPEVMQDQTLYALVDGNVTGPYTVANGGISGNGQLDLCFGEDNIDDPRLGYIVTVGLKYNSDFESLDVVPERGSKKVVVTVTTEFEGSRGAFAGQSLDDLEEMRVRQVAHDTDEIPLLREEHRMVVSGRWAEHGRAAVRVSEPIPFELLGIMREVEVGG